MMVRRQPPRRMPAARAGRPRRHPCSGRTLRRPGAAVDVPAIVTVEDGDADSTERLTAAVAALPPPALPARLAGALGVLHRFSRPHTMLGTAVSVASVSALALGPGDATAGVALRVGAGLLAALLMNVAIVGVNQVYDVEIDKV